MGGRLAFRLLSARGALSEYVNKGEGRLAGGGNGAERERFPLSFTISLSFLRILVSLTIFVSLYLQFSL